MIDPSGTIGSCCEVEWTPATARLERAGPHWKAACGRCGRYLRFLPQAAKDFRLFFGKHQGKLLTEVWRDDPAYCEWLAAQDWVKPRLRAMLAETKLLLETR